MGNWTILIQGIGQHHNGNIKDADRIAQETVAKLAEAGQGIHIAQFIGSMPVDISPVEKAE